MWILAAFALVATLFVAATIYQNSSHPAEKTVVTNHHDTLLLRVTQEAASLQNDNVGGSSRHLTRSAPFQIKSEMSLSLPSGDEIDLCVAIKEAGVESDLIIEECVDGTASQLWIADQFGRFHSWTNRDLCISPIGGEVKKCNFNSRNAMSINGFSSTINIRKNGSKVLSYVPDGSTEEVLGSKVSTFGSAKMWSTVPSDVFPSKEDLPLDEFLLKLKADRSMCVAASDLARESPLILEPCDASNSMQLWKYEEGGMIKIASRETKCIVKGSVYYGEPSLMIGTPCRRLSNNKKFTYDVVTLKIVHTRSNRVAFTVDGDNVVMGYNHPRNNAIQQFVLDAP